MHGPLRVFLGFYVAVNEKNRSSVNLRIYIYVYDFPGFSISNFENHDLHQSREKNLLACRKR